ncbi:MAG TPA: SGNH/GDSL hydrolase family protein [Pirellulales bacterium]|nr:SGNH/GDSL hydrolase family protein [Pirellulales bacterium]
MHDPFAINRREWFGAGALGAAATLLAEPPAWAADGKPSAERKRDFLRPLVYMRGDVAAWLARKEFPFSKYDAQLGYLHVDRDFREGVDGSVCTYRYDPTGARHMVAHAEKACRINTYGDSFTSCEQVSDGETWQELLAAHLGEPIRNFGIGGYSVYQAYLRMKREEPRSPARLMIVNIFDDDHYRNLLSWQRIRFGVNRKSTNPPVPHVKFDAVTGELVECANPCPTAESLDQLCDLDTCFASMENDYVLGRYLERESGRKPASAVVPGGTDFDDRDFTRDALRSTMWIVEKIDQFAAKEGRKVLYVLSYGAQRIRQFVKQGNRFDQPLVDFLDSRGSPCVDLLKTHTEELARLKMDLDAYLSRYYIGHYNPLGNFFCAFALKRQLVEMLDPPPPAYSASAPTYAP